MKAIITDVLTHLPEVRHWQKSFLTTLFTTMLLLPSKVTFSNLGRYSALNEKTYRRQFRHSFNFEAFNQACTLRQLGTNRRLAAVIDASYVPKSGKKTFGLDLFYSSSAGKAKRGLEVSEIALVDLDSAQAYGLSCRQTQARVAGEEVATRPKQYACHLKDAHPHFPAGVELVLFDGYYAKRRFVDEVCALGLHGVGKLRVDADLRYLYRGPYQGRGRPKRYDGKVDITDRSRMVYEGELEPDQHLFTAVVWSCALKRIIRLALIQDSSTSKPRMALLFSTDPLLAAREIVRLYKLRFQVEFLIRDAKQFAGLSDCQVRDEKALAFHFNASFSTVNLAKLQLQQSQDPNEPFVFSLEGAL